MIKRYFKIWKQLSACAISSYLSNRIDGVSYFLGKLVRFLFFVLLIVSIFNYTDNLAGYDKYEVLLFFLTFSLVDTLPQAFFRGIYMFRKNVIRGDFDYTLAKPVNPLFYTLTQLTDILDILFLFPVIFIIAFIIFKLNISVGMLGILLYILFVIISQIMIVAIHIISACVTIWTLESENLIWFYRESMTIGRFPAEVYSSSIQFIFTYLIPTLMVVSFPVKILLGTLSLKWILFFIIYSGLFFLFSLFLWKISLKKYSSASS